MRCLLNDVVVWGHDDIREEENKYFIRVRSWLLEVGFEMDRCLECPSWIVRLTRL